MNPITNILFSSSSQESPPTFPWMAALILGALFFLIQRRSTAPSHPRHLTLRKEERTHSKLALGIELIHFAGKSRAMPLLQKAQPLKPMDDMGYANLLCT